MSSYFYLLKGPSFERRKKALAAFIEILRASRAWFKRISDNQKARSSYVSRKEKYLAYLATFPLVTIVPLFNVFELLCTFFIQIRTYADVEESFDPKFNGSSLYQSTVSNATQTCNSYCRKGRSSNNVYIGNARSEFNIAKLVQIACLSARSA